MNWILCCKFNNIISMYDIRLVVGQEKDVSLFLDRIGETVTQQRDSSRLKNKDTSFSHIM